MNKMFKTTIALIALTAIFSFATDFRGGFKLGLYGAVAGGGPSVLALADNDENARNGVYTITTVGIMSRIGGLFYLGRGLEASLGLGLGSRATTTEVDGNEDNELGFFVWEVVPGVSYRIGKKDFISFGPGLDLHISSYSIDNTTAGNKNTTKPKNINMAFFPNFFIKAEIVKNFDVGLKTGIMVDLPGNIESGDKTIRTTTIIETKTEVFVSFYL